MNTSSRVPLGNDRWIERALREQPLGYAVQAIRHYRHGQWQPLRHEWLVRPESHWNLRTCEFIDGILSIGQERALDRRVLDDAASFLALHPGTVLAVNLFAASVCDRQLPGFVQRMLQRHQVSPRALVLEITEHEPLTDLALAAVVIGELRRVGVRVGLDDVGSGCHATPTPLQLGMVDHVKLDRELLADRSPATANRLAMLARHAQGLGLEVVAEGVESAEQAQRVLALGVTVAQGYLWDLPQQAYVSDPCGQLEPARPVTRLRCA